MWIYWKEQCRYCKNSADCKYKKKVMKYIEALSSVDSLADGIYGSTKFECDYFVVDEQEYYKHNEAESSC